MTMYCKRCGDRLMRPQARQCASCGEPFDPEDPGSYHATGPWRRPKEWLLGLSVAVLAGCVTYAIGVREGELGTSLFVLMPMSVGIVLGMTVSLSVGLLTLLLPLLLAILVAVLYQAGAGGAFCLSILYLMCIPFALVGLLLGAVLRRERLRKRRGRTAMLLLVVTLPLLADQVADRLPPTAELVVVQTTESVEAPAADVWRCLHFYEEIETPPPLLLRLGLPVPVRARGSKAAVGSVEVCVYEGGRFLVKRIVEREEDRRLAFEIIGQHLHFERDLTLLGGAFDLAPAGARRTDLTLTTRYRARTYPAWMWRWLEAEVLHTLHGHVIAEIRRRATQSTVAGAR